MGHAHGMAMVMAIGHGRVKLYSNNNEINQLPLAVKITAGGASNN